jgi:hypothetical protein
MPIDNHYSAKIFINALANARCGTKPFIIYCEDDYGFGHDFYVKLRMNGQHKERLVCEYVGTKLAIIMGICTPNIGLIHIPENFYSEIEGPFSDFFRANTGINYGTKAIASSFTWDPARRVPIDLRQQAFNILIFDLLTLNFDRRDQNTNIILSDNQFFAIDHEHCLCFDGLNMIDLTPWDPTKLKLLLSNHAFSGLRIKDVDEEIALNCLNQITPLKIDTILESVPPEWYNNDRDEINTLIKAHLENVIDNKRTFVSNIRSLLK